jgi:hypothetical protein
MQILGLLTGIGGVTLKVLNHLFFFNLALRFPCVGDGIKFLDADMS